MVFIIQSSEGLHSIKVKSYNHKSLEDFASEFASLVGYGISHEHNYIVLYGDTDEAGFAPWFQICEG